MNKVIPDLINATKSLTAKLEASCSHEILRTANLSDIQNLENQMAIAYHKLANKRMVLVGLIERRKKEAENAVQLGGS